jgi:hypothetical protein
MDTKLCSNVLCVVVKIGQYYRWGDDCFLWQGDRISIIMWLLNHWKLSIVVDFTQAKALPYPLRPPKYENLVNKLDSWESWIIPNISRLLNRQGKSNANLYTLVTICNDYNIELSIPINIAYSWCIRQRSRELWRKDDQTTEAYKVVLWPVDPTTLHLRC